MASRQPTAQRAVSCGFASLARHLHMPRAFPSLLHLASLHLSVCPHLPTPPPPAACSVPWAASPRRPPPRQAQSPRTAPRACHPSKATRATGDRRRPSPGDRGRSRAAPSAPVGLPQGRRQAGGRIRRRGRGRRRAGRRGLRGRRARTGRGWRCRARWSAGPRTAAGCRRAVRGGRVTDGASVRWVQGVWRCVWMGHTYGWELLFHIISTCPYPPTHSTPAVSLAGNLLRSSPTDPSASPAPRDDPIADLLRAESDSRGTGAVHRFHIDQELLSPRDGGQSDADASPVGSLPAVGAAAGPATGGGLRAMFTAGGTGAGAAGAGAGGVSGAGARGGTGTPGVAGDATPNRGARDAGREGRAGGVGAGPGVAEMVQAAVRAGAGAKGAASGAGSGSGAGAAGGAGPGGPGSGRVGFRPGNSDRARRPPEDDSAWNAYRPVSGGGWG